jgi:hypothetical protein
MAALASALFSRVQLRLGSRARRQWIAVSISSNDAEKAPRLSPQDCWLARLIAAGRSLDSDDIKLAVREIEAIADHRKSKR